MKKTHLNIIGISYLIAMIVEYYPVIFNKTALYRAITLSGVFFLLIGCQSSSLIKDTSLLKSELFSRKFVDYQNSSCEQVIPNNSKDAMIDPSYWLRLMQCANVAEGLAYTQKPATKSWDGVFKQAILASKTKTNIVTREEMINQLNQYQADVPSSVRGLYQLWAQNQYIMYSLQEQKLQAKKSDEQLIVAKQREKSLHDQLDEMYRKVASLTDIEQQLSSRKLQNEIPVDKDNSVKQPLNDKPTTNDKTESEALHSPATIGSSLILPPIGTLNNVAAECLKEQNGLQSMMTAMKNNKPIKQS